jgi:sulfoxide reductase heme-binding subunit YedZ
MFPWNDRNGQFSLFKACVFAAALTPAVWLAWRTGFGLLGPRPWAEAIHRSGDWALRMLFLSLAVTPVRVAFSLPQVMAVRRMLGLTALGYALLHLGLYVGDQALDLAKVASEIATRVYLTIGFAVVLGLVALGVTSTDSMIKRLGGRRWRALHRLVYPLAILGTLHFFMQSKLEVGEATLMAGALVWLLAARVPAKLDLPTLLGLAAVAAAATAVIEAAWINLKTGAPMAMILAANIDPDLGPRPSWLVLGATLAVVAVAAIIRKTAPGGSARRRRDRPTASPLSPAC